MLSIFRRKNKSVSTEQEFWNWFLVNKKKIEDFIDSEHNDYSMYNLLTKKMRAYHDEIVPELTKTKDEKYVLIITPDGIKAGIEPTKALAAAKPEIDNWIVEKFRQPCDEITLEFKGVRYPSSDIEVVARFDSKKELVNIDLFIRNMNKDPINYKNLAFLYLDHILGEFNVLTKIGYIELHNLDENKSVQNSINLLRLRELIAEHLY
ncbi:MAG: hypothetical protein WBP45_04055 [Daejeonella sp.]